MLQQRGNRDDEKSAAKSQRGQPPGDGGERQAGFSERRRANGQADCAERNEAGFNFPARKVARREAADADADGRGRLQIAGRHRVGNFQRVLRVDDDDELDERGDAEKIGVAHDGHPQLAVAPNHLHLLPQIGDEVGAEFFLRIGGGNLADAKGREQAGNGERDQDDTGPGGIRFEDFAQPAAGDRAADDGDESAEFQIAVAPGKFFLRQQFRQQSVFGRAEERAVNAHQKHAGDGDVNLIRRESEQREEHDEDFKKFHPDDHAALAETVGEKTAGH